jgi:catechol 2,3-dioxygenase-like lactoylglutathione lyase family enzyme
MKRFHVHVSVEDLDANIRFYSTVFGQPPAVRKDDYAKWMLDDPRVNFAISQRGAPAGLDHLGVQVDSSGELTALREQVQAAEIAALDQTGAQCCYAKSDKYWITDPQGIAWETFHSLDSIPVFGADTQKQAAEPTSGCCAPVPTKVAVKIPVKSAGAKCC